MTSRRFPPPWQVEHIRAASRCWTLPAKPWLMSTHERRSQAGVGPAGQAQLLLETRHLRSLEDDLPIERHAPRVIDFSHRRGYPCPANVPSPGSIAAPFIPIGITSQETKPLARYKSKPLARYKSNPLARYKLVGSTRAAAEGDGE
jgi:hypothetical protein